MNQQKKIPLGVYLVSILLFIAAAVLVYFLITATTNLYVYYDDVDYESKMQITKMLDNKEEYLLIETLQPSKADLIFTYKSPTSDSVFYKEISSDNLSVLPSSIRKLGVDANGKRVAVPIQLDHPELLIKKDLLTIENNEIIIPSLSEFITIMEGQKQEGSYPLMIAGLNDASLFDIIQLLTISTGGYDGHGQLIQNIEDFTYENIENIALNDEYTFKDVLNILIELRRKGLLHNEWLSFDYNTALSFIEDDLASAMTMRLHQHRQLAVELLRDYEAIPFPELISDVYARDTAMVPLFMTAPAAGQLDVSRISSLAADFISAEFQNAITFASGFAPVNANSTTMDKQASDVRYWAAASGRIVPIQKGLYSYSSGDISNSRLSEDSADPNEKDPLRRYSIFLNQVREYLLLNR